MQEQLDKDLKTAMLAGDKVKAEVIRGLKNALQYEAVAQKVQPAELSDDVVQKILAKEAKKRAEAIELYEKAGEIERANGETAEKAIIDAYLPERVDEAVIEEAVKGIIAGLEAPSAKDMGQIIGSVKAKLGNGADGGTIARITKEHLS